MKSTNGKGAILVADDVPVNLRVLADMLRQQGYKPRPVSSGVLALQAARRSLPDLVLLDIIMPGMDGYETCRQMKADPVLREIPVLFVSGLNEPMDKLKAFNAGGVDYITKPFQFEEVAARIGTHLELSQQRRELQENRDRLEKAQAKLSETNEQLEQRVQERTAALVAANTQLKREIGRAENAENERREVLRQFVTAQEDERRRVATELHDRMGQHLAAIKLWLKQFVAARLNPEVVAKQTRELQAMTDMAVKEVHDLAWELRPISLDEIGLQAALRRYVDDWSRRVGIATDFICNGPEPLGLPSFVKTTLYRIVQEALTNIAKHALASEVCVALEIGMNTVAAVVKDNGKGFDVERVTTAPDIRRRLGLLGMEERADLVGGTFEIKSIPRKGTSITVTVPMNL